MRMRRYPDYKSCPIEWIGEMPSHWDALKLKYIAKVNFSNVDKHTVEGEEPIRLCNYVDVYHNDYIHDELNLMHATATSAEIDKFALRSGDVIITKDSESWDDIAVPAFVPNKIPGVLCGYHLAQIRPGCKQTMGEYLFRSFCSRGINDQFRVVATGVTRYGLGKHGLDNGLFLVPPIEEQHSIARFLNRETKRIDALIEKKQRQIELLEEKRISFISQVVKRGLDPHTKLRNSGIEWLSKMPAHWTTCRARFLYRQLGIPPSEDEGIVTAFRDGQVTLREQRRADGYTFAVKELGYQGVRKGHLVIHSMDAFAGAIGVSDSDGKCTGEYVVCEPRLPGLNNHYYAECLRIMARQNYIYVICPSVRERAPRFRYNRFKDVLLPVPPAKEQESIVTALMEQDEKVRSLVRKIEFGIEKLREYRTSIITAAVTGQIDVREEVS